MGTADSWHTAATNPFSTVLCLMSSSSLPDLSTSQWTAPSNMDLHLWSNAPSLPFSGESFDLVSTRSVALLLPSTDWPSFMRHCVRVLKPGGSLEISVLDPMPRNAGPLLQQWTTVYLILGLERKFSVTRPAMVIPFWLKDVTAFAPPVVKTMAFSAVTDGDFGGPDSPM